MSGKLIFNYGTMRCGKSSLLIQKAYQFAEVGKTVLVLRPATDTRSPEGEVSSRIGISWPALNIQVGTDIGVALSEKIFDILLVDESNFFTAEQVDQLAEITEERGCMTIAFGLKCDFAGNLFDASKRLVELADRLDEMPSMCDCGKKATKHFRLTEDTAQFVVGDEIYKSVCRSCFFKLRGYYGKAR